MSKRTFLSVKFLTFLLLGLGGRMVLADNVTLVLQNSTSGYKVCYNCWMASYDQGFNYVNDMANWVCYGDC